jgi:hypothetical protein
VLHRLIRGGAVASLVLALAACSSSSPSGTPGGGGGGGGGGLGSSAPTAPQSSTGSGGGSGPAGSGGAGVVVDPCTLLTQAEVAGVVGFAVAPGDSSQDPHACAFTYHDPADALGLVSGTVSDNIRATEITKNCQSGSGAGLTVTQVSGVGDVACWVDGGVLGTNINFVSHGQGYEVSVLALGTNLHPKFPSATAEAMEKALALDVIAKL